MFLYNQASCFLLLHLNAFVHAVPLCPFSLWKIPTHPSCSSLGITPFVTLPYWSSGRKEHFYTLQVWFLKIKPTFLSTDFVLRSVLNNPCDLLNSVIMINPKVVNNNHFIDVTNNKYINYTEICVSLYTSLTWSSLIQR